MTLTLRDTIAGDHEDGNLLTITPESTTAKIGDTVEFIVRSVGGEDQGTHALTPYLDDEAQMAMVQEAEVNGKPGGQMYAFGLSEDGDVLITGDDYGYVYISATRGKTWRALGKILDNSVMAAAVSADGQKLLVSDFDGRIRLSVDGGDSFSDVIGINPGEAIVSLAISDDGNKMLAGGYDDTIYQSLNGGESWESVSSVSPADHIRAVAISADGQIMLAGSMDARLYFSTDGGNTWEFVDAGDSTDNSVYSLALDDKGQNAIVGGYELLSLSGNDYTLDSGEGIDSVAISADGLIALAGSQKGVVYQTLDGGENWTQVPTIDSSTWIKKVAVSADGSKMLAADGDGKIHESTDSGASWHEVDGVSDEIGFGVVAISRDGGVMLAGTNADLNNDYAGFYQNTDGSWYSVY